MRVVFLGSPEEVIPPLQSLMNLASEGTIELVGVVSQPARPSGRKNILTDPPLAAFAKSHGLTVLQPERVGSSDFLEQLATWRPDVCITAAFGQILSEAFLSTPKRATINIHPSLLPAYRGATPVPAALLDGLSVSGVTILFTVKQLDAGAIIIQKSYEIEEHETNKGLTKRLFESSAQMLPDALRLLQDPSFSGTPQNPDQVTFCRKIGKEDGLVDWHTESRKIFNRFRAYDPWPGSYTFNSKGRVVITAMTPTETDPSMVLDPGKFLFDKKREGLVVGTKSGQILVTRLKPAGSKEVDARAFWNGLNKDIGEFYHESIGS